MRGLYFTYHGYIIHGLLSNTYIARSIYSDIMGKFLIFRVIHFIIIENYIQNERQQRL